MSLSRICHKFITNELIEKIHIWIADFKRKKIGSSIGKNIPELGQCYIRLLHGNVSDSFLFLFMQYTAVQKS